MRGKGKVLDDYEQKFGRAIVAPINMGTWDAPPPPYPVSRLMVLRLSRTCDVIKNVLRATEVQKVQPTQVISSIKSILFALGALSSSSGQSM